MKDSEPQEIRLAGRQSEDSEGVADEARSVLLMEAVDSRGESEERGGQVKGFEISRFGLNVPSSGCLQDLDQNQNHAEKRKTDSVEG